MSGSQLSTLVVSASRGMRSRKRSIRSPSRTPKTARRMTSSVIACILGRSANASPARPAADLPLGGLGHHVGVATDRLPVEGRQQQLALAQVAVLVEGEQRVLSERVAERACVRLAGVEHPRVAGEDALDLRRVGHVHHAPEDREVRREAVAVAAPAPDHPPVGRSRDQGGLNEPRQARPLAAEHARPYRCCSASAASEEVSSIAACVSRGRLTRGTWPQSSAT